MHQNVHNKYHDLPKEERGCPVLNFFKSMMPAPSTFEALPLSGDKPMFEMPPMFAMPDFFGMFKNTGAQQQAPMDPFSFLMPGMKMPESHKLAMPDFFNMHFF